MVSLIDTHAHLDFPDFAPDLGEVIERAALSGVTRIIAVGTDLESSRNAVRIAAQYPGVFATVGWHPGHASEAPDDLRPALRDLARSPKVVAIGECGLDFHRLPSKTSGGSPEEDQALRLRQERLFEQQLEVAAETRLNVVIHTRDSWSETLAQFAPHSGRVRGVFHCFAGTPQEVAEVVRLGSLISVTGILTFKNGGNVRTALASAPPGAFMLETDCPYLAPVPHRGRRCEPAHVRETAAVAAAVTGRSLEQIAVETSTTAAGFFRGLDLPTPP
ncbi:MAG: TatD family hydrolase [Verrucomicrobiales bacterium]|nr:TatD family hydrolase [Verrucomicrobiales bacterium]